MQAKSLITQRIFLVGCPRSGTTLFQRILAGHSRINSFPETHFFPKAYGLHPLKRWLTWPALNVRGLLKNFVLDIGRPDLIETAKLSLWEKEFQKPYLQILDQVSLDNGKDLWLEKTPRNLHFIKKIILRVPKVRFIHIVRPGTDVVASLYQVTHQYPDYWHGGWSIDKCIQRWNNDIRISQEWVGNKMHLIIPYPWLIENHQKAAQKTCNFLKIAYEESMLNHTDLTQIIRNEEKWKFSVANPIKKPTRKFELVFSQDEQAYILSRLISVDFC